MSRPAPRMWQDSCLPFPCPHNLFPRAGSPPAAPKFSTRSQHPEVDGPTVRPMVLALEVRQEFPILDAAKQLHRCQQATSARQKGMGAGTFSMTSGLSDSLLPRSRSGTSKQGNLLSVLAPSPTPTVARGSNKKPCLNFLSSL